MRVPDSLTALKAEGIITEVLRPLRLAGNFVRPAVGEHIGLVALQIDVNKADKTLGKAVDSLVKRFVKETREKS